MLHSLRAISTIRLARLSAGRLAFGWLLLVSGVLAFYRLDGFPEAFYDEGMFARIAQNTAFYGRFGNTFFDTIVPAQLSVGPVVLLPVAAVYRLFGVGIWQSRLLIALSGIAALLLLSRLAARLYSPAAGLIAWTLALLWLPLGSRALYGEVPAIALLLAGAWCWLCALRAGSGVSAAAAGLAFGMMIVAKPQALIVVPALLAAAVADMAYYRCWPRRLLLWMALLLPAPALLAVLFQAVNLGWQTYRDYIWMDLTQTSGASVLTTGLGLVFRTGFAAEAIQQIAIGVPCLLLSVRDCRERTPEALVRLALVVTAGLSLTWYVLLSSGWPRYGWMAFALLALFAGARLADLSSWLNRLLVGQVSYSLACRELPNRGTAERGFNRSAVRQFNGIVLPQTNDPTTRRRLGRVLPALGALVLLALPLALLPPLLASRANDDLRALAIVVERDVPRGALVETYEWPIGMLVDRRYHHPSLREHNPRVQHYLFGEGAAPPEYVFWTHPPEYLVAGSMAETMRAYPQPLLDRCGERLAQHGAYTLYRLREPDCFEKATGARVTSDE